MNGNLAVYRHGDLLIVPCKVPTGVRKPVSVLAHGEATGHAHRVALDTVSNGAVFDVGNGRYLVVTGDGIRLDHEEHGDLRTTEGSVAVIPAGEYEVVRKREYAPEEIRNVTD